MLNNIKSIYLHCVFHGIRFKVNNELTSRPATCSVSSVRLRLAMKIGCRDDNLFFF